MKSILATLTIVLGLLGLESHATPLGRIKTLSCTGEATSILELPVLDAELGWAGSSGSRRMTDLHYYSLVSGKLHWSASPKLAPENLNGLIEHQVHPGSPDSVTLRFSLNVNKVYHGFSLVRATAPNQFFGTLSTNGKQSFIDCTVIYENHGRPKAGSKDET